MTTADVATLVTVAGAVTPPIGAFLVVIKWIVNFQREITDKYREELHSVRTEFDAYKLENERRITNLERQIDALVNDLEDERIHKSKIISHMKEQGLELPLELDRRKENT